MAYPGAAAERPGQARPGAHHRGRDGHLFEPINWGLGEIKWFKRAVGERARTLEARASNQARGLYEWLTRQLGDAEWFGGTTFGLGDLSVVPYLNGARANGIGPDEASPLGQWLKRANGRPSVAKSTKAAAAVAASMTNVHTAIENGLFSANTAITAWSG